MKFCELCQKQPVKLHLTLCNKCYEEVLVEIDFLSEFWKEIMNKARKQQFK